MEPNQATHYSQRIEHVLAACLPTEDRAPARLHEAMRYGALSPGKRVRPRLVYATATALGVPLARVDGAAAAIELIHAYSLVHDDLPAMDDDDLRRGRPTTHKAFDDATAILAGDALQSLAFEIVATHGGLDDRPAARVAVMRCLAAAVGSRGMVGGQALDMASEARTDVTLEDLETIHNLKTGALLSACVMMAASAADDLSADVVDGLEIFAQRIGLAFQVRDDVLDIEATTEQLGKQQGADLVHDKATYPALMGLAEAKAFAERLYTEATAALDALGGSADDLRALAAEIVKRDR